MLQWDFYVVFYQCPTKTKNALCVSLVWPILEYVASVWAPYIHSDVYQLEAVQEEQLRLQ